MRFVDSTKLSIPEGWEDKAAHAKSATEGVDSQKRSDEINRHRDIWSDLKPELEKLSFKKCWYCESRQIRSDKHVDHFRPKNRVREASDDNSGYWWLAFDWQNYRYSCTFCNSPRTDAATGEVGGKADQFPLRDEDKRCCSADGIIADEQPVLLDPTEPADPILLWFDEDGTAQPRMYQESAPWPSRRARESILIYHLNHTDLKEARQAIAIYCKDVLASADGDWAEYVKGSVAAEARFKQSLNRLRELLLPAAEYSAAAAATLRGLRDINRPWLDGLLDMP